MTLALADRVRVLFGDQAGSEGVVIEIRRHRRPVFRGGLLPDVFPGPPGLAGSVYDGEELRVEFDTGYVETVWDDETALEKIG